MENIFYWFLSITTTAKNFCFCANTLKPFHYLAWRGCVTNRRPTEERNSDEESKEEIVKSILSKEINLVELDLRNCDIQSLPEDSFHHRLEKVNLENNKGRSSITYRRFSVLHFCEQIKLILIVLNSFINNIFGKS